ncbi:type III secretion system export apparatus subunit SctT [Propionivibrio dicarboxylicus]|uniref:Type III secretion protein T n=1 Tax=Propionivibrio dicarboxylicus TaxID=83767 RepID=A0A1G7WTE0_9RHOO|nr:type III secretion system export apparatus subunit SctT [Propionivibrio dicarboxylicus]SDG75182.1 type III secretion protein T [Propionivibrio dicarboxylicus]
MDASGIVEQTRTFLIALLLTQPRILALFIAVPLFNRQLLPGMLRFALAAGLGAPVAPALMSSLAATDPGASQVLICVVKEVGVGFVLGYLIAVPFWAFEAVGFLIDNQRGASISATLNPLTGNDSSPLGILFNQAFIVFFLTGGGVTMMLQVLYDSFRIWDVFAWMPSLRSESMPLLLDEFTRIVRLGLLFSAPAIVAMFLAEIGLALISRFVPQLDVFFLAMPIKSGLAMLVLLVYLPTLFYYAGESLADGPGMLSFLRQQWEGAAGRWP